MKIGIVWKDDYPWDVRVEKMANALRDQGHTVHILARNRRRESVMESLDGLVVHRLYPLANAKLNNIISLPIGFNPMWYYFIRRVSKSQSLDALIVRDLPLMPAGILAGRRLGIPVIFDMAENYPALWREVALGQRLSLFNIVLKNPTLGAWLENLCVKLADRVLVVVEESRSRLLAMGVLERKIAVVSNTPSVEQISKLAGGARRMADRWRDRRVLIYQGYVNRARGLQVAVRALPGLVSQYRDLLLVVVGTGNDIENLKCLSRELSVEAHTEFTGWVSHNEIPAMVLSSIAGLIPHSDTEHKRTTVPNKLFDYMACAKPVIVSSVQPLKRIVETEQCGVVFQAGDETSFAQAVRCLLDNPQLACDMGRRGEEAVRMRYNWQYDSQVLAEVVGTVARGRET